MSRKIAIIGSDSFIGTLFYNSLGKNIGNIFSRQPSAKPNEIVKDLFTITVDELKGNDITINFAALVHQPKNVNAELYKRINVELPVLLASKAKKAGVRHFIQMSSIAVYGDVDYITENSKENPVNIYGKTKYEADLALLAMQDKDFNVTIVRPPMVYGGGKAPGNMQKLLKVAILGIPLPFKGITNRRDFINVHNLVDVLNLIIEKELFGIVIPTDRKSISTSELLSFANNFSTKKIRQFRIPKFAITLLKKIKPSIVYKVFGDSKVECNLPLELYTPEHFIETGIGMMVKSLENKGLSIE